MSPPIGPASVTVLFIGLVVAMLGLMVVGLRALGERAGLSPTRAADLAGWTGLGATVWLALVGMLALRGFFLSFAALPPRIPFALLIALVVAVALARSAVVGRLLDAAPASWLILPQAFRIVMEMILWLLVAHRALPEIMTFTGRNIDIVVGLTAPLVAWSGTDRPRLATVWNVAGIAILTNVVIHAQLSVPGPFQMFRGAPPITLLATFPYVWLPTFLVPLAFFLHLASIRQVFRRRARAADPRG